MALELDFLTQVVNVHWRSAHFLYSGADGMFRSSDGQNWTKLQSSVPAVSLAYIDGVWVGCNHFAGCWRSEDGANTWESAGILKFEQVAAMRPKGTDAEGKPMPGVFAGWLTDESDDNDLVYTSHDLGKTWSKTLTIPKVIPFGDSQDGYEKIQGLSGCGEGGGFFVCTIKGDSRYANGDGMIYSSMDGTSFNRQLVFGPGTNWIPYINWNPETAFPAVTGFTAQAVGFDEQTKTYIAIGNKETRTDATAVIGITSYHLIYTKSGNGSFAGGSGNIAASSEIAGGTGDFMVVDNTAAGGGGVFVSGFGLTGFVSGSGELGELKSKAIFIPGASQTMENRGVTSFCFKAEGTTDEGSQDGLFACVSYSQPSGSGGVYIAKAGGPFRKTHSGTSISGLGAVAVTSNARL